MTRFVIKVKETWLNLTLSINCNYQTLTHHQELTAPLEHLSQELMERLPKKTTVVEAAARVDEVAKSSAQEAAEEPTVLPERTQRVNTAPRESTRDAAQLDGK